MIDLSENVQMTKKTDNSKLIYSFSGEDILKVKEEATKFQELLNADSIMEVKVFNNENEFRIDNTGTNEHPVGYVYHNYCNIERIWNGE